MLLLRQSCLLPLPPGSDGYLRACLTLQIRQEGSVSMKITISKTGKPLNHKLWPFIYLLCFLIGMCGQVKCEDITKVTSIQRVEYRWQLYVNLQNWYHTWRMFYGKPNRSHTRQVSNHEQPSSDAPQPPGREWQ